MEPDRNNFHSPTILIVDDDSAIRTLIQAILSNEGYTTLCAQNGYEALELSRKHTGEIDLVISDLVMPRMNGAVLGEHLAAEHPATAILFISGYRDMVELPDHSEFLPKPFGADVLLCRVQQLLSPMLPPRITPKAETIRPEHHSKQKTG